MKPRKAGYATDYNLKKFRTKRQLIKIMKLENRAAAFDEGRLEEADHEDQG